ncbi:MAG: CAAD domain-containing protein [Hydrococcus sp. Prado102]|nr:CAAD domain-containing protein [Hydrococcus sp. Prado102]
MSESLVTEKQLTKAEISPVKLNTDTGTLAVREYLDKSIVVGKQLSDAIALIPQYWSDFWQAYQRPVKLLGWIVAGIIVLKVALAVLDAVNDFPLLAPTFELVGFGYGAWFIYRFIIGFASRQELSTRINNLKSYLFGQ